MNVERWKELINVIDCKSLTAAAEKLGYTLSGISRSISALENECGIKLLYRGKKGVKPTEECLQLMPYIRDLIFASDRIEQTVAAINGGETGIINIGTAYRHYYKWLVNVTSEFHNIHSGVHFRISNGTSTDFARQLEEHSLDFCIISQRDGNHSWYPMCTDELIALLPINHRLTKKEKIPVKVFEKEPYIATCPGLDIDSSRFFDKLKIKPNIQFSSMDIQATYAMVDAGMGISLTNEINSLVDYEGICHRKTEPTQEIEIGLACAKELSPVSKLFLEYIIPRLPKK